MIKRVRTTFTDAMPSLVLMSHNGNREMTATIVVLSDSHLARIPGDIADDASPGGVPTRPGDGRRTWLPDHRYQWTETAQGSAIVSVKPASRLAA